MTPANPGAMTDLLGNPLTPDEHEVKQIYDRLLALSARRDLAPCVLMNVRQALVMLWNACVDLNLVYDELETD
jgi:hypothetical protein